MVSYFLKGILIGLLFGVPVGAVGALTAGRTINYGARAGLLTGLGSSVADCFYACVCVFGLTVISDFLLTYQIVIHLLGGGLVLYMGLRLLFRKTEAVESKLESMGFLKMFLTSFAIGITNPAAILTFLFAFSYFGISGNASLFQGMLLIGGVFIGTWFWWSVLTILASVVKKKAAHVSFRRLNQVFGCVLCLFGVVVIVQTFL